MITGFEKFVFLNKKGNTDSNQVRVGTLMLEVAVILNKECVNVCVGVCFVPVYASVVVVPIKELDFFKGLLTGIVTGQIRMHAKKQVQCCCPCEQ